VNESNDLVSIIVVAHAYPDWVRDCLDSIAAQTHKNFECIVVLDNDPQGQLANAVRGPFADDPRFCFESMPGRRERNHCRNRGIEMARGHWVNVVDGDDFLPPDSLEIRLAAAARHPGSTIFGRVRLWSDGHAGDQLIYQNQYVFNDLRIAWPSHCTLLLERQRLDKVRYPEHVEDGEQAAEFLAGEDVHFLNLLLQENQGSPRSHRWHWPGRRPDRGSSPATRRRRGRCRDWRRPDRWCSSRWSWRSGDDKSLWL
jgi:glycosyltransferase involved in cell wall biosynthesis